MKRGLIIAAVVALVCAVGYLSWLNPATVTLYLTPTVTVQAPLAAVLVGAAVIGALVILSGLIVQGTRRSLSEWWQGRSRRRSERADSWQRQGEALIWEGETERGRGLLLRAWRHQPTQARAALAAAASHLDDGDPAAAEQVLREALEHHRGDPQLLLALSQACSRQGDQSAAVHALEQIRARHPRAPRVLTALRAAYAAGARWPEAVSVQRLYLRNLSRPALISRERERLVGLEYEAALTTLAPSERVTTLEGLVHAHPTFVPALVSLGDALSAAGRDGEAAQLWEHALRNVPRTVFVERLLHLNVPPRQRQSWRQQLRKLRPAYVRPESVRFWQARLQFADGDAGEVLKEIDALAAPLQTSLPFHELRAEVLRQLGHVDQALQEFAAAHRDGATAPYACRGCGQHVPAWVGRCAQCDAWDSYRAAIEIAAD